MNGERRVSFYTLGCRLNQAETAQIAQRFRNRGYRIVEHGDPADVAVIHTCSVTERADQRCRQEIRKVRRGAPDAVVCAVGCYAQSDPETVGAILGVDLVVGNDRKYVLPSLVDGFERSTEPEMHVSTRLDFTGIDVPEEGVYGETRANVKVQDGCDFHCAFCILPRVRGGPRSRPFGEVLDAARRLVDRGHRELVLTGVNIGLYRDGDRRLVDVARALSAIHGLDRVRVSSIEPSTITDDLLDWVAGDPAACQHLHVPIQSGDDAVLAGMARNYTRCDIERLIERIREHLPEAGLGTDVIVGFPGETDASFDQTRSWLSDLPLNYLHVFSYSDRPRTQGIRLPGKVDSRRVKARSEILREMSARKRRWTMGERIGRDVEVLLETVDGDGWRKGWTRDYLRVGVDPSAGEENDLVTVRVERVERGFLTGPVREPSGMETVR